MEAIILNKKFFGPYASTDKIKNRAGIYLIVCEAFGMTPVRVLVAGDAENIKETLRAEKKKELLINSVIELPFKFLVHYENDNNIRAELKRKIKKELHPVT
ncbi:MAG: hypothetical protein J0M18_17545 [Ignavibacteria bacterium]|nr:hypothetical protein [Ignavibacteria bacterium]